ncbi:hypothetical protein SORBI_3001G009100 [Sorghum bicolor]|uniref:Uncharacterized protein n=1 Tax=Sorghum bicolor TaxID=4558 RepID=A0A1Z5S4D3_SORBI|nr:hypothetical protein SORBI_3001G009100 [Sorghum bicolor]
MRKWVVNLLSAVLIVVLLVGLGYRVALVSTIPNPVQNLIPSLGLSSLELGGGGRGAGAPAKGDGGAADPPPPAARRSGPQDGGGGRTPSAPSGSGGGARTPSAPSGSGPPRMDSAPPPPPPNTQKSLLKGGSAGTGDAAAAASPPCLPCGSFEEKVTRKVVLLLGCGISTLSFSSPVIIYWSLGSSLPETITFHSLWDLIATAANCLAWLLFGITQLHIEGMHWSHRRFVWSHFRRSVLHRVWALQERKFGCNMDLIWCSTCAILLTTSAVSQPFPTLPSSC